MEVCLGNFGVGVTCSMVLKYERVSWKVHELLVRFIQGIQFRSSFENDYKVIVTRVVESPIKQRILVTYENGTWMVLRKRFELYMDMSGQKCIKESNTHQYYYYCRGEIEHEQYEHVQTWSSLAEKEAIIENQTFYDINSWNKASSILHYGFADKIGYISCKLDDKTNH